MRMLAEYVMRGRLQAISVALVANMIPMLCWLGAAVVALVILRRSIQDSLAVILWSSLPAIFWAWQNSPLALLCLLGAILMAVCLRWTMSWEKTLLLLVPSGVVIVLAINAFYLSTFTQIITAAQETYGKNMLLHTLPGNAELSSEQIKAILLTNLIEGYTAVSIICMLVAILLARMWQSALYNHGGFKKEICSMRLSALPASTLLLFWITGLFIHNAFIQAVLPGICLPLLISGIALVHGLVNISTQSRLLLVIFYLLLLLIYPLVIVLACLDSFIDFRGHLTARLEKQ